ncbi:MAG: HD domain-containing protein [Chthonomonadaceae bacterium]|nr:HD domain-containing protein [Chthonomonadaceae bacterium]
MKPVTLRSVSKCGEIRSSELEILYVDSSKRGGGQPSLSNYCAGLVAPIFRLELLITMPEPDPNFAPIFPAVTPQPLPSLAHLSDTEGLVAYLKTGREHFKERALLPFLTEGHLTGLALTHEYSNLMDCVLKRMFVLACEEANLSPETVPIAVVATGGYGRRELCPYSDIDITFIPQRDNDAHLDRIIRQLFKGVMDVLIAKCGLEVGYAYRLLEDCGSLDHQTLSGLLDARLVAGNQRLFIKFEDAYWTQFNPAEFIFTKVQEYEKRREKWGASPRVVEPQLKEGAGGLRDIHTAIWTLQARENLVASRVRGDRAFDVLQRIGDLSPVDAARLAEAKEFLFRVRSLLHLMTGAERDQLVVTRQEEIASRLGFASDASGAPPVEVFMRKFFRETAHIERVCAQVVRRMENSRLILGIGLDCWNKTLLPANPALLSDDPAWLLWAFEIAQKYALTFGAEIETAVVFLTETEPILPDPVTAAQVFTRILCNIGRVFPILQKMADCGALGWFLPEFAGIYNLIPYDPSHESTVGQHTLFVIQNLELLLIRAEGEEQETRKRLLCDLPHPEQLILAALLHDAGKAHPGRPHAEVGAEMAEKVCRRLYWSAEATANVVFLVKQHLVMAETSRLRDLSLDDTIRDFTQTVDDLDRLNMLYLLTYADTRAVGEGIWTAVKGHFLQELWSRAATMLSEVDAAGFYDDGAITRARRRLMRELSPTNLPPEEIEEHVAAMPPHYLLGQSLTQIALQINYVHRVRDGEIVVDFQDDPAGTFTEITVVTQDDPQPGLLSKIAGTLFASHLAVHGAQVVTRTSERDIIALDTLWADYRGRTLPPGKRREITKNLQSVLGNTETLDNLMKKRDALRPETEYPHERVVDVTAIRNDVGGDLTLIETRSHNLNSTLYRISVAMAHLGWSIKSARISPWFGGARASFYVVNLKNYSEEEIILALSGALSP